MKIHVLCSKEELKRTDEIQEALSYAMKPLTDLGFKGKISIEESNTKQESDTDEVKRKENAKLVDALAVYNPYRLSDYSLNGGFAIANISHGNFERAGQLVGDALIICQVLEAMDDVHLPENTGAHEARGVMEKFYTKVNDPFFRDGWMRASIRKRRW